MCSHYALQDVLGDIKNELEQTIEHYKDLVKRVERSEADHQRALKAPGVRTGSGLGIVPIYTAATPGGGCYTDFQIL